MNYLKKIIGNCIGFLLVMIFTRSALKQFNKQVLSIYFHNPPPVLFKEIVRFLDSKGFRFIDEQEYFISLDKRRKLIERTAFISFDDGWRKNLKLLPTIEEYKIPVTFFIPVRPVITGNFWWEYAPYIIDNHPEFKTVEDLKKISNKKRMKLIQKACAEIKLKRSCISLSELNMLNKNPFVSIGSHSYHHPITTKCTNDELEIEYRESKNTLENWLDTPIYSFSYPNGDYDERDIEQLKANGYQMAFTVNSDTKVNACSPFQMPRVSVNSEGGKYENLARILRIWHQYVQPLKKLAFL